MCIGQRAAVSAPRGLILPAGDFVHGPWGE
jgi:hypothetical protein